MPVKKDKRPILVKFNIADKTGDTNACVYGDWQVIYMSDKSITSAYSREIYGTEEDFDLVILLDASPTTKRINEQSVFLINEYPTENNVKGNYRIKRLFPEYLGLIRIGLESIEGKSTQRLYYLDGENIYSYSLNYDRTNNLGYVGKYDVHPFAQATTIWKTEPLNSSDTVDRIQFVSETNVGIINNYKVFKQLTFSEVIQ